MGVDVYMSGGECVRGGGGCVHEWGWGWMCT